MTNENKEQIRVVNVFSNASNIPNANEDKDRSRGIIKWGSGNDYPLYLIDLLNGSATHGGIVKGKVNYIAGEGIRVLSGDLTKFLENPYNPDHTIEDIVMAMVEDLEVFGMMAIKGTWNMTGERVAKWEYMDMSSLRISEDRKTWKYSNDWTATRQDDSTGFKSYPVFNPENPVGSFVIVWTLPYKKGRNEKGYYGKPPYISCITDIDTERQISIFHRNNIYNAFKLGTLVTFTDGMPENTQEAKKIAASLRDDASSMDNAGGIKVTFADGKEKSPIVQSLTGDDLAERYLQTAEFVESNIVKGHSAISGLLFGVKTEGQLGGATEMMEAFDLLDKSYLQNRKEFVNRALSELVRLSGFAGEVEIVGVDFSEEEGINRTGELLNNMSPLLAGKVLNNLTVNEIRAIAGLSPVEGGDVLSIGESEQFSAKEKDPVIEEFKKVGRSKKDVQFYHSIPVSHDLDIKGVQSFEAGVFDTIGSVIAQLDDYDKNVLSMVRDGQDGTSIAKATDSTIKQVAESMERLRTLGLLTAKNQVTNVGNDVVESADIPIQEFEVLYSYEVRSDVPPAKSGSREFCQFLIDRDMLYTRAEIEDISNRVDRDVWRYRGGFYNNPRTGDTTPWCRHFWQLNLVRK
jgi:hypothetical protein